ncbi:LysR family transcriptional regulator [Cryptosporangium aurantiacum]|uniref:Transcriptional regulator, LysR family n=1 Tax=Cryptosporangium aurantiacum TaxID=134849 RepID=A0A1M7RKA2_9ACTN|nr:LysR family transcriptional regulator [Cryptosporangium aurantiacum]SHN46743.1 transcriptional regulator, LysR family [Cryptosporangium aurantiacum]
MKLGQVDLNLLVVLDALLREKNVTRAAERLHMSQPATSTALARLRKVLGDELLTKHGRYLELTPRAESLIEPVREVLATIEQTIVRPPVFDPASDTRRFTVIASDYVGAMLLRPLLGRLSGLAAGLRLDAAPVGARYLTALQRDELDIAILPDRIVGDDVLPACSRLPVLDDRFVGAVWTGHPRAGDRLDAELLASSPYLMYAVEGARAIFEDELDAAGCVRHVVATASTFMTMPFMLAGTELVAMVPERLARRVAAAADIRILEPAIPLQPLRQSAYWHTRRDRDPGHVWLREELLAVATAENAGLPD